MKRRMVIQRCLLAVCCVLLMTGVATTTVSAKTVLIGDVDANDAVNTTDARLILQYAAEMLDADEFALSNADVYVDRQVNTADARCVLQIAAGTQEVIQRTPLEVLSTKTIAAKSDDNRLIRTREELDVFLAENTAITSEDVAEFDDAFFAQHALVQLSTVFEDVYADERKKAVACDVQVQSMYLENSTLQVNVTYHSVWERDDYRYAATQLFTIEAVDGVCGMCLDMRYSISENVDAVHESRMVLSVDSSVRMEPTALVIKDPSALKTTLLTRGAQTQAPDQTRYPTGLVPDWIDSWLFEIYCAQHDAAFFENHVLVLVSGVDSHVDTFDGFKENADGTLTALVRRTQRDAHADGEEYPVVLAVEVPCALTEGETVRDVEIVS